MHAAGYRGSDFSEAIGSWMIMVPESSSPEKAWFSC